ncbi:hypothetical protein GGH12_006247, partial [Coemansia sp. RSA 1822]
MYNKLARAAMSAGTAIHVNDACNTAPAPATHHLIIETKNPDRIWAMQAEARNAHLRVQFEWAECRAQQAASVADKLQLQVIDLTDQLKRETARRAKLAVELETERGIHAAQMEYCRGVAHIWADQMNGYARLATEYAEQYDSQAKGKSQIANLAKENIAQREIIAELKATIEQLKTQHADELNSTIEQLETKYDENLKIIGEDLTQLARYKAKEQALADAERKKLIRRVELAEDHIKQTDAISWMYTNQAEQAIRYCQCHIERAKRADKTAKQGTQADNPSIKLANGLMQPADERSKKLAGKAVERQDKQVNKPKQLADKLADKQIIPEVLYDQVGAAKNKITSYKEMAHKIVELLRTYKCRRQLNYQKPESDLSTA